MQRRIRRRAGARRATIITLALLVIVAAATLFAGGRAGAQNTPAPAETGTASNGEIEITVKAGFGRLEVSNWNGAWVPFRINIVNQGPAIVGRLIVHTVSDNNGPTSQAREFVKEIQLPTGARQSHEIAAYINSGENPSVRVEAGDRVVIETTVPVQRNYGWNDQLDIAVVDTDPTALNNISQAPVQQQPIREPFKLGPRPSAQPANAQSPPNAPGQPPRRSPRGFGSGPQTYSAHPTVIAPEDLPRDFVAYDMLDALVINDAPLSQLSEEQARAIRLWVASGGLLVVTGGADIAGLRANRLDEILPIEAGSVASAAGFPVAEMTQIYGGFETAEATLGMNARVKQGARPLLGTPDRPLVAERDYGSGVVRFVALNPKLNPYRGWNGAKELWADLLWPAAVDKPHHTNWITMGSRGPARSGRWGVQDLLFHLAEIQPPSTKYVIFFLLAYVLLVGPVNYAVLRWRRKTDLAWLTIPAVVILFTLVSVAVAQMSHGGRAVVADASFVQVHQAEGISNVTSGLLVVPANKEVQQLTFAGGSAYASDVFNGNQGGSASTAGAIECERDQKAFVLRTPMTTRTASLFQLRAVRADEPPLVAAQPSTNAVTIKNLGNAQMVKAVYLSAEGASDIFELAAGDEQRLALKSPPPQSFNAWYSSQIGDNDESELFNDLAGVLDREVGGDRAFVPGFFETQSMLDALKKLAHPIIICFVEKSPAEITFNNTFKRTSKAFYVIHL
ncbi:MAG TPA: hypothetical protein VKA60_13995 [Blastocatellia bacterium]|nr:hypothetical protein [Blastocatellia bacterium]